MKRICVYCGARPGSLPSFAEAARRLGRLLARRQMILVYGGGNVGLMGILADAVLEAHGQAIGIIPQFFIDRGLLHAGLQEVHVTQTMHERKALMLDMADAFIALPGGLGTFEELLETLTWAQLDLHHKPVGALDVEGFFRPLLTFIEQLEHQQLMRSLQPHQFLVEPNEEQLLNHLERHAARERNVLLPG
jgi:uncharacterized protein (TIGR00730 family)